MTLPRQVVPGWTYMLSRRCTQRQYLLRPSRPLSKKAFRARRAKARRTGERIFRLEELGEEAQLYLYATGLYAEEHEYDPHGAMQMGNHHHQAGTDRGGKLPKYTKMLHGQIARAMNVKLDRGENFWAGSISYSAVKLETADAILRKLAYIITNPVAAGLVARPEHWPGVCILPEDLGKEIVVQRPAWFFRDRDKDARGRKRGAPLPETVTLTFTKPPQFADMTLKEFQAELRKHVEARIAELHAERRRKNRVWREAEMDAAYDSITGQDPFGSPVPRRGRSAGGAATGAAAGCAPGTAGRTGSGAAGRTGSGAADRDRISPRVACRDRWKRQERLEANAQFVAAHREAREAFRQGDRTVRFPPGTWAAVVVYGAKAHPAHHAG